MHPPKAYLVQKLVALNTLSLSDFQESCADTMFAN